VQEGRPVTFLLVGESVATLVSPKWGCQTPTPENGSLESSETPENSEDNLEDQNTSPWGFLYTIGKVLKRKCLK
jgi:hypothetical protein